SRRPFRVRGGFEASFPGTAYANLHLGGLIVLVAPPRGTRISRSAAAEGPGCRAAGDRGFLLVVKPRRPGAHRGEPPSAAQEQRGVSQQTGAPGARECGSFEALSELSCAARQPRKQVRVCPLGARVEFAQTCGGGLAVPRADILADVAAEDPIVQPL